MFSWVDFNQSSEEGKSFMPDLKAKFERKAAEEDEAQVPAGDFGLNCSVAIMKS